VFDSVTRSTWTRCRPSCSRWLTRRSSRQGRRCGFGRRTGGHYTPGHKLPMRCARRCSPGRSWAFELGCRRSVVPSCTRSSRGVAARPVSNLVSIGGSGPVRSRTPPALRSSATRDRSAGRARQGRYKPRPTDHLLPKPVRPLLSPARAGNGAGRGRFVVVRSCPLGPFRTAVNGTLVARRSSA
jgi:hypothetical protein